MKRIAAILFLGGVAVLMPLMSVQVSADVNDFTITSFESNQVLTREDAQGKLYITENIEVVFRDNNHGIIRAIPNRYKGNPLNFKLESITSATAASTSVQKTTDSGNVVLRIGDPDKTVTGTQKYSISYSLENVISFYDTYDELYWDVNGDQWRQPASVVRVKLTLPEGSALTTRAPECFAAVEGQTENCTVSVEKNVFTATAFNVPPLRTLTYVAGFDKEYFTPPTLIDVLRDRIVLLAGLVVLPLIVSIIGLILWIRYGRDKRGRGVIIPEYEVPAGITPLAAGAIMDFSVDNKDVTASYIDLGIRGYIKIHEKQIKRKLRKDTTEYAVELVKNDYSQLTIHETNLLQALFPSAKIGDRKELGQPSSTLNTKISIVRSEVKKELTKSKFFKDFPLKLCIKLGILLIAVYGALWFWAVIRGDELWPLILGIIISASIAVLFVLILPARSETGVALREKLLGLKLFLNVTEKDRLNKLQAPNAAYAVSSAEPERTIELFEKLLPYAIVLGVEKQWARQFEDIYMNTPDWYQGSNPALNAVYLTSAINSGFSSSVNTSFSSPSNSSSSGFGGGYSGGGGGGGGGGGW